MDFERATLNALFYDYPIGTAMKLVKEGKSLESYLKPIPNLLKWRMPEFGLSEYKRWVTQLKDDWIDQITNNDGVLFPFMLLPKYGEQLFDVRSMQVQNLKLLRWREISLTLSEDLLVCSTLAWHDVQNTQDRDSFLWVDVIPYDNDMFKQLAKNPLYDVHAHLDASSDAFNISWIDRMNQFNLKRGALISTETIENIEEVNILDSKQEKSVVYWNDKHENKSYLDWVSLAALLRYWIYKIVETNTYPTKKQKQDLLDAIEDSSIVKMILPELYKEIDVARQKSPKPNIDGTSRWDYAIQGILPTDITLSSPYMVLWGERRLLYGFFRKLYTSKTNSQICHSASIFYLYLIIKLKARKEVIQTNELKSLSNYQVYQGNDLRLRMNGTEELHYRYAMQTAVGTNNHNFLEGRINPEKIINVQKTCIERPLFGSGQIVINIKKQITLIGCISKPSVESQKNRDYILYRKKLKKEVDVILTSFHAKFDVVGLDFAGSDTKVRPEVFAQTVRYAREKGIVNFTYHAGEDFFDLLDGLRTIYEIIYHLRWGKHCRLGHVLALYTDAEHYYSQRHYKSVVQKQILLDNLVWLFDMSDKIGYKVTDEVIDKIDTLYEDINYPTPYNKKHYMASMKMRGNNVNKNNIITGSVYTQCAEAKGGAIFNLRKDKVAINLLDLYINDEDIYRAGTVIEVWQAPKEITRWISDIQKYLKDVIQKKGIGIESCPTSNKAIGYFDRFDELPVIKLSTDILVSINTDNKGILATNIENEYAIIYAALQKKGEAEASIISKLNTIRQSTQKMKFRK